MKKQLDVQTFDPEIQRLIDSDEEVKILRQFKSIQSDRKSKLEMQVFIDKRIVELLSELDK